jgi:hypothetical protein
MEGVMIKIDKGIPVSKVVKHGPAFKYPWWDMKPGDSFIYGEFTRQSQTRMYSIFNNFLRNNNLMWKFKGCKTPDGMLRIWRIK